jgi:hypothetical protein
MLRFHSLYTRLFGFDFVKPHVKLTLVCLFVCKINSKKKHILTQIIKLIVEVQKRLYTICYRGQSLLSFCVCREKMRRQKER